MTQARFCAIHCWCKSPCTFHLWQMFKCCTFRMKHSGACQALMKQAVSWFLCFSKTRLWRRLGLCMWENIHKENVPKRNPPWGVGGFLFCCFWLFGQANGTITIKFRIAFGCLGSESHAQRRSSMNLMEIMAIGQWDHCKPWMINNQLWPRKDGWRRWGTYMDLWGIIPTAYGDLNVGDEALH